MTSNCTQNHNLHPHDWTHARKLGRAGACGADSTTTVVPCRTTRFRYLQSQIGRVYSTLPSSASVLQLPSKVGFSNPIVQGMNTLLAHCSSPESFSTNCYGSACSLTELDGAQDLIERGGVVYVLEGAVCER